MVWRPMILSRIMTSFQSKKRLNYIFCFFIVLIACSCNESKETPIKVDLIPWEKAKGKIIVFDYYYALITNSETRQIDTLLKTPAGLQIGEYCILWNVRSILRCETQPPDFYNKNKFDPITSSDHQSGWQ